MHPDVDSDEERELLHLIAEADRLQRLIAGYMAQVNRELELAPHLRRATTAYTRGGGTAF